MRYSTRSLARTVTSAERRLFSRPRRVTHRALLLADSWLNEAVDKLERGSMPSSLASPNKTHQVACFHRAINPLGCFLLALDDRGTAFVRYLGDDANLASAASVAQPLLRVSRCPHRAVYRSFDLLAVLTIGEHGQRAIPLKARLPIKEKRNR